MGIIKPSFDSNRQVLGKIYPIDTPFTVILDSSEACNFKCNYCFRAFDNYEAWGDYAVKKNLMSWNVFEKAIEQIKEFPHEIKQISLSCHGEPLCNPKLPEMIRYIKSQGLKSKVSIHTNGSLLNKSLSERLAESEIDKIVISLQGMNEEKYKKICDVKINYSEFYENIKYFFSIKKAETRLNIKIMDIAVENKSEEFFNLFSSVADNVFIEKVVPIWKNTSSDIIPEKITNKYGTDFPYQKCCPLLFNTLVVTPDGDVYPCTQILSKEKLGNIEENTLLEMWNDKKRKDLLKRQLLLDPPESCNGCGIKQNSIFTQEDMIDDFRYDILKRLEDLEE